MPGASPKHVLLLAIFAFVTLLPSVGAKEPPPWTKLEEKDGITVFQQDIEGSDLLSFRAVAVFDAKPLKVLSAITDHSRHKEWVQRLSKTKILKRTNSYDIVYYQSFKMPFGVDDRDFVLHGKAVRKKNGVIVANASSVEWDGSPKTVGVRAALYKSRFELTELPKGQTRVDFEVQGDPKGWIPDWVTNRVQGDWPMKTLNGLRAQCKKSDVKPVALPPKG
jgi:hypothetical protein